MDLNQLLHAHQVAAMQVGKPEEGGDRPTQFDLVAIYARRIRLLREQGDCPAAANPFVHGETVLQGSAR